MDVGRFRLAHASRRHQHRNGTLLGNVLNTHLTFIAREIFPLGLRVDRQWTVPDGPAIREALASPFREAEIIFVTGGLGPTTDDITREAAAELLGLPLRQDPEVAAAITKRLRTRGFPMTDRILRQADVPGGRDRPAECRMDGSGLVSRCAQQRRDATPHLFLLPGRRGSCSRCFENSSCRFFGQIAPSEAGVG